MLRCPPSRIHLTPADISAFQHRLATRATDGPERSKRSNVRLSPGPGHQTRYAIVSAEGVGGGVRKASPSAHEATLYEEANELPGILENVRINTTDNTVGPPRDSIEPSARCDLSPESAESTIVEDHLLPLSSPRRQVDSFYGTEEELGMSTSQQAGNSSVIDGSNEKRTPRSTSRQISGETPHQRDRSVLGETYSDAFPTHVQSEPQNGQRCHARCRSARNRGFHINEDPEPQSCSIDHRHTCTPGTTTCQGMRPSPCIHELILPAEVSTPAANQVLDPGAPVFIPRTRFGTAAGSSSDGSLVTILERRSQNPLALTGASDLRILSSSEQNIDGPIRRSVLPSVRDNPTFSDPLVLRRRGRGSEQNATNDATGDLERYSVRHPPSVFAGDDGTANVTTNYANQAGAQRFSRAISRTLRHSQIISPHSRQSVHVHQQNHVAPRIYQRADSISRIRSPSPALPANSWSTPNLLRLSHATPRTSSRSSLWLASRSASRSSSFYKASSEANAGGNADRAQTSRRRSTNGSLDATSEFLRMRNSPLDDLTEKLSRLSTNQPRSVGRSWERDGSSRSSISLLAGDPFRQDPSTIDSARTKRGAGTAQWMGRSSGAQAVSQWEELPGESFGLPPSPIQSFAVERDRPNLPRVASSSLTSDQLLLAGYSRADLTQPPSPVIKRKPLATGIATPKVKIYDDSKRSSEQPKTPSDVSKSARRARLRSDTALGHYELPIYESITAISYPPAIPERHPHRNTYPSASTIEDEVALPSTVVTNSITNRGGALDAQTRTAPTHRRHRINGDNGGENNDSHDLFPGLEEDRRTWLSRYEDGALDVTPPKEGRFERYLS